MVTGSSSMTIAERLARFAARASYDDLSEAAREQLKIRVLDALACAIGALDGEPVRLVRAQVEEFDDAGPCSLIGGGHAAPDRAAFYNSALVRYLDFNDSFLTKGETCHPSDKDKMDESPVAVLLEELVARREEFTLPARARLGTARRERDSRLARVHQHPVSGMRRARVADLVERSIP